MKKIFYLFLSLCLIFLPLKKASAIELDITSNNAILINQDEQKVLYEKNAQEVVPIASLTKIMTAIITIENIDNLDTEITITSSDLKGLKEANAAVAGFRVGQKVTIRDLLYGLLLPSGADAAQTLTRNVTNNREEFIEKMNEKAKELNLQNTHFKNETGLDAEGHVSTVEEVAKMLEYALQNKELKTILTSKRYTMHDGSFSVISTLYRNIQRNSLNMDYLLGGKTGTTDNAGLCLASIASKNGTNYILVTVKAPQEGNKANNFLDAKTIYEYFIDHYQNQLVIEEGEKILTLPTRFAKENEITFYSDKTWVKYLPKEFTKEDLKIEYLGEEKINYNTLVGSQLGKVNIYYQDELLKTIEIVLNTELHFDLMKYLNVHKIEVISCSIIILIIILWIIRKIKKRKKSV